MSNDNIELLNIINDIDDVIIESENDVLNSMYADYIKTIQICEHASDFNTSIELIMESNITKDIKRGAKKFGRAFVKVLTKIWNVIKAAFNTTKRAVKRLIARIKKNSVARKATKTTNQILHDLKNSGKKISKKNKKFIKKVKKVFEADGVTELAPSNGEIITIPASDLSEPEYKNQRVKVNTSDIVVSIFEGKDFFEFYGENENYDSDNFNANFLRSGIPTGKSHDDNRFTSYDNGEDDNMNVNITTFALVFYYKKELFEIYNKIADIFNTIYQQISSKKDLSNISYFSSQISELSNKLPNKRKNGSSVPTRIGVDRIISIQEELDNLMKKLVNIPKFCEAINSIELTEEQSTIMENLINSLGTISQGLFDIQLSLNMALSAYENIWVPDSSYFESIDDYETLDAFVDEMIKNHIPQKAIMKSVWLCSSPSLRGDDKEYAPIWGQMRGCFIPPNTDFIYKIALSEASVRENKSESDICKTFSDHGIGDVVAKVIQHTDTFAVTKMEKLYGIGPARFGGNIPSRSEMSHEEYVEPIKYIRDKISKANLGFQIGDLHINNIGFRNNRPSHGTKFTVSDGPAIIDYGFIYASSKSKDKATVDAENNEFTDIIDERPKETDYKPISKSEIEWN